MTQISNINNTFESYQKLISFYQANKDKQFEDIHISITKWFAANMCSALGGLLDILSSRLNNIKLDQINPSIERILQKNDFLSYFDW